MEWDKFKRKRPKPKKKERAKVEVIDYGKISAITEKGRKLNVSDEIEERALRAAKSIDNRFFWGGCQPEGDNEIVCRFGIPRARVDIGRGMHEMIVNIEDLELEATDFDQLLVRDASKLEKKDGIMVVR